MKKALLLMLAAGLIVAVPADARKKKKKTDKTTAVAKPKDVTRQGLFNVTKSGDNWFFEVPDSLVGRKFLTTTRFTATPANCGKFAGEQVNQQTVYWEKAPSGKTLLLRADLLVNAADSTDAINKAIVISNENPVIGAFKIESSAGGKYKINVTKFFNDDNVAVGLPAYYGHAGRPVVHRHDKDVPPQHRDPHDQDVRQRCHAQAYRHQRHGPRHHRPERVVRPAA